MSSIVIDCHSNRYRSIHRILSIFIGNYFYPLAIYTAKMFDKFVCSSFIIHLFLVSLKHQ